MPLHSVNKYLAYTYHAREIHVCAVSSDESNKTVESLCGIAGVRPTDRVMVDPSDILELHTFFICAQCADTIYNLRGHELRAEARRQKKGIHRIQLKLF